MKIHIKAFAGILSVILLTASIGINKYYASAEETENSAVAPWNCEYISESFGAAYDVTKENGLFSAYGGVSREDFEIVDGRLKGTYGTGSGTNNNGYYWATKIPSPESDDIGVKADIDISGVNSALRFRMLLSIDGVGYLQPAEGTAAYLVAEDGSVTVSKVDRISAFSVPAGFKGSAAICFNAFFDGNNDKLDNTALYKQSQLNFQIRTFDVPEDNTVIYFDNVAYISNTVLEYNKRTINSLSGFSTGNVGAWRDGSGNPTYTTSGNISVSESGIKASYPILSGNRMFANIKLWENGKLESTDTAVSVDIDATGFKSTSPKLQIRLNNEGSNDNSIISDGAKLYLMADTGEILRVKAADYGNSKGSYIMIPAGFKGTVFAKLSDFTASGTVSVYNYAKMTFGCVVIDVSENADIVYSNINYYSAKAELPWKYSNIAHDFSAFKNNPTGWGAGSASSLFKTAQSLDSTGGNLKVTYPKISGNEMTWELKLGTESVLKETDGAVSLDVDASALTYSPKLQFQLRQEGGSYYRTAVETEVYFVSESGEITTVKTAKYGSKGAYVSVPAGFKGTVVFALGDYTDTNAADGSSVYGITNMTVRLLAIDINEESVITYDNIRYCTGGEALENAAGIWLNADCGTVKLDNTDGISYWLSGKLAATKYQSCTVTGNGYVYALDSDNSAADTELVSQIELSGSIYNLVRKAVKTGDTVALGNAMIICPRNVYFGDNAPVRFGDCNSDKKVNICDLVRLREYIDSPDSTLIYARAAKTDLDSEEIGDNDFVKLRKYLVGAIDKLVY